VFGSNNSLGSALDLCSIYMRQCHDSFSCLHNLLVLCPFVQFLFDLIHCHSNCLFKMLSFLLVMVLTIAALRRMIR
jgi:hypothetical protein